jgi:hypothetical protein
MPSRRLFCWLRALSLAAGFVSAVLSVQAQGAKQNVQQNPIPDSDADHIKERNEWFFVRGKPSAELRRRAYLIVD